MIRGIAAIVRADFLIRFRRLSTVVVFLLLSAFAWVWIPDPATGRALMRVGGARVLYNSAAIGIASAMLAALFTGLVGFYVVSNAIGADLQTRCGSVIASTNISSSAYLAGKLAGNITFLATFTAGFMLASMAMVVIRGEAPLEPSTFVEQYLLLVPSTIVLVSALAIVFESIPLLAGRGGDVFYFFLWTTLMGGATALVINHAAGAEYFDFTGLGLLMRQIESAHHATSVSIGAGPFDAARPLVVLTGLPADAASVLRRVGVTLAPLALLLVARPFFHRFDPARVRAGRHQRRRWGRTWDAMTKPLARLVTGIPAHGAVAADAMMTFALRPAALIALVALAAVGAAWAASLPIVLAGAAVLVSDVATRDRSVGATGFLYAMASLRERYVAWKLASALAVASVLLAAPALRLLVSRPAAFPALAGGVFFVAGSATALGVISSNPKAFIVLFLSFWYVVVNDRGATPALDFAGLYGTPAFAVTGSYVALAVLLLLGAEAVHRSRLRE